MPTTIQPFDHVKITTPTSFKPLVESRPRERKEDFRQHLDDAATANKPAETTKPASKPVKAEPKKAAGKTAAGGKAKGKADHADDAEPTADGELDAAEASAEGAGDAQPLAGADAEAAEARADADHAEVKHNDGDGESGGDAGKDGVSPADATVLAQTAAAVKPVTATKDEHPGNGEGQPGAKDGTSTGATTAIGDVSAKGAKGLASARAKAVGAEDGEAGEEAAADGAASEPTAALADAVLKSSGKEGAGTNEEGTGQADGGPAARVKKATETKPVKPELGLQQVESENKPEKPATKAATASDGPIDPAAAAAAASQVAAVSGQPSGEEKDSKTSAGAEAPKSVGLDATAAAAGQPQPQASGVHRADSTPAPQPPPEVQFADANHDSIVTGVKAQLLPHGGSMQIRLDPPELGALKVMVEMRDGAMTATFQTSNEDATRLLSHSLNQLKHVLEGQGVSVERLQVQQAPKGESGSSGNNEDAKQQQQQQNWQDEHAARQEQQRKEVLRRMWRRVAGVADPIDVTA